MIYTVKILKGYGYFNNVAIVKSRIVIGRGTGSSYSSGDGWGIRLVLIRKKNV